MGETYELVNWIMLGGAGVLGLAMGANYLLLLLARRQKRQAERSLQGPDTQSPPPLGPTA